MSRDEAALIDMDRAGRKALRFRGNASKEEFLADEKSQSAILHQLLVLGEAAKRVSSATTARAPSIPWRLVAGLRDRLIHAYDVVDLDEVWIVLERDVPNLLKELHPLLPRGPK